MFVSYPFSFNKLSNIFKMCEKSSRLSGKGLNLPLYFIYQKINQSKNYDKGSI
jgi:hypothetical protein